MLEEMIMRCPECGQWVQTNRDGIVSRAANGWSNTVLDSASVGSDILGDTFGAAVGGAVGGILGYIGGLGEALVGDHYNFECPTCGHRWSTDDEEDDESFEYEQWDQENDAVDEFKRRWYSAESDDDYIQLSQDISDYEETGDSAHLATMIDLQAMCSFYLNDYDDCIKRMKISMDMIHYDEAEGIIGVCQSLKEGVSVENAYDSMCNLSSILTSGSEPIYLNYSFYKKQFDEMVDIYTKQFRSLPPLRRKYLTIVSDYRRCYHDVLPLKAHDVPSEFIFPGGRPIEGVLYVANPVKPNIYYKADEYELSAFRDQLDDFLLVLSKLGAKKLSFHDARTSEKTYDGKSDVDVNVSGAYGDDYSGSVHVNDNRHMNSYRKLCNDYFREMEFHIGKDKPSCPTSPWFDVMSDWQSLAHQRLDMGTALKDHRRIALSESATLQREVKDQVEAQFKAMKASGNVDVNVENDHYFSENSDICWEYDVEFYPLEQYYSVMPASSKPAESCVSTKIALSLTEQEYLDEIKYILEDGEIGLRERKSLERLREKLGISSQRAKAIEESLAPKLTSEEQEYLSEVKYTLEDGEIGPRERKSLDRCASKLGISPERAKEIEALAN